MIDDLADDMHLDERYQSTVVFHREPNVWWRDAPLPRRIHRCRVWTLWYDRHLGPVHRCPCGATRIPRVSNIWIDRNLRRKEKGTTL